MPKKKYVPKDKSPYIKDICDRVYHNGLCQIEERDCPLDVVCNRRRQLAIAGLGKVNSFIRLLKKFATFEKDVELEIAYNERVYNSLRYGKESPEATRAGERLHELVKDPPIKRGKNVETD